jgi:hypothetical protein
MLWRLPVARAPSTHDLGPVGHPVHRSSPGRMRFSAGAGPPRTATRCRSGDAFHPRSSRPSTLSAEPSDPSKKSASGHPARTSAVPRGREAPGRAARHATLADHHVLLPSIGPAAEDMDSHRVREANSYGRGGTQPLRSSPCPAGTLPGAPVPYIGRSAAMASRPHGEQFWDVSRRRDDPAPRSYSRSSATGSGCRWGRVRALYVRHQPAPLRRGLANASAAVS